jgi:hypothetical protein
MKKTNGESGQTLIIAALSMVTLLGFVGFAADVGLLFRAQRNMQIGADAAAIAAALDYKYNVSDSSAETAGICAGLQNFGMTCPTSPAPAGPTYTTGGDTITVNCPPVDGPNTGTVGFCEAQVSESNSTFFMGMFKHKSITVAGRAVAGAGVSQLCVLTLAKSGIDIAMTGSGSLNVSTCNVYDDSNASDALDLTGSGSISAREIGIVGSDQDTGSGSINICNPTCEPGTPTTGMAVAASPINPSPPTIPTGTATTPTTGGSAYTCSGTSNCTISPGDYSSITNNTTGTLTFSAGTYNVTGNITNSSGTIVSNTGTYTFNVGGNIQNNSSGAMTLGGGTTNVVGNIDNTSSGAMTLDAGNYVVNGSIQGTGSGALTLGAGDYIINQSLSQGGSGALTLGAGDYTIAGNFTDNSSGALNIGAGLIITEGNLDLTGSSSLTATSDTFFTEGSTTVSGSGSMDITAPTSGTYNGIAFYQPSTDNSGISITGSGSMTFQGIVYAPDSQLSFSGSGGANSYADFIVDSLNITGSGSFQSYQTINPSALLGKLTMVE